MMTSNLLVCAAVVLSAGVAHADPVDRATVGLHATVGVEVMSGEATSAATRGFVGIDVPLLRGSVQPTIGAGVTLGLGQLGVEDPRALSGTLSIGYFEWGPEVRVGVRFVNGGFVDKQLYASFATLRTTLDDRLMLDAVEGVGGTRGMRAAVGFNYAEALGRWAASTGDSKDSGLNWVVLLMPSQVEATWERSCGSDRMGVNLSWGI